jgi:hypothetical protein
MNTPTIRCLPVLLAALVLVACATPRPGETWRHGLDDVWRSAQFDWSAHRQVRLAPVEIDFARDLTAQVTGTRLGHSPDALARLRERTAATWTEQLGKALRDRGFTLVEHSGPGVLDVSVAIGELMLSPAFDDTATPTWTYTRQTARAQLSLVISTEGRADQLLRIRDRAGSREDQELQRRSALEARADLEDILARWARATARLMEG